MDTKKWILIPTKERKEKKIQNTISLWNVIPLKNNNNQ